MNFIKPGILEVYTGPMFSRKTAALIDRIDQFSYLKSKNQKYYKTNQEDFLFIKPDADTRDTDVTSKGRKITIPFIRVHSQKPYDLLDVLSRKERDDFKQYVLVAIDEAQFFGPGIEDVVVEMQRQGRNVLVAGADLDFRGEPFGRMDRLVLLANEVYKLTSVCEYPDCSAQATRTQRLINGRPAPYDAPIISIEGAKNSEKYEARCLQHHEVPGKPTR
jgi:thymidine kinase